MSTSTAGGPGSTPEGLEPSDDPIETFTRWFEAAGRAGIPNFEAAALATATPDGRPSVRMVLVRGFGPRGFVFFTNYESRKAAELEANPRAALALYWEPLGRQVRIEGAVERTTAEESDAYFASRPFESKLGAWASPQSRVVESRVQLEQRVGELEGRYRGNVDVPRPPFWGGYRIVTERIELWIADPHRLHDRFEYTPCGPGSWTRRRLGP